VQLKRELWAKLLTTALGTAFADEDELFVEHTLLVNAAEIIAHAVVGIDPADPSIPALTVLEGGMFTQAQIAGVVEADFFDWVAEVEGGSAFVKTMARRLTRFNWEHGRQAHAAYEGRRQRTTACGCRNGQSRPDFETAAERFRVLGARP